MSILQRAQSIVKKKALHQTMLVTFGSLVNGAALFGLNILLARALVPEQFGIFAIAILVVSTAGEISDFGLNHGLLRFAPYYKANGQIDKWRQLLKIIWQWRIGMSAGLTALCLVLAYPLARYAFNQTALTPYLVFTSAGIGGVILLGFLVTFLQSEQRFVHTSWLQSLKGGVRIAVAALLFGLGVRDVYAYLAVYIFVPWVLFLVSFGAFPKRFWTVPVEPTVRQQVGRQLAQFSFWLTISSLISIVAGKIDQVMISRYLGLREVAEFTVAWQLVQLFPVVIGSVTSVLMPRVGAVANKIELVTLMRRVYKWIVPTAVALAIGIYWSQYLIVLLFGQTYAAAMPVYLFLAYGLLGIFIAIPFSLAISAFNRTQIAAMSAVIQLVVIVGCNVVFIPWFGIIGSAYTFAIGCAVQCLWNSGWALYLLKKKEFKIV